MSVFAIAISIVFFSLLAAEVYTLWRKNRMHATEQQFREAGIVPYGSGICHGMVLSPDKAGVLKDQKNTPAWYNRLD